ncbi:MAG TPA: hypothetical protein VLX29_03015 [Nitrospirota bacterium]|nr:hypothetical protein [Nitrospirota bacterium]
MNDPKKLYFYSVPVVSFALVAGLVAAPGDSKKKDTMCVIQSVVMNFDSSQKHVHTHSEQYPGNTPEQVRVTQSSTTSTTTTSTTTTTTPGPVRPV